MDWIPGGQKWARKRGQNSVIFGIAINQVLKPPKPSQASKGARAHTIEGLR